MLKKYQSKVKTIKISTIPLVKNAGFKIDLHKIAITIGKAIKLMN